MYEDFAKMAQEAMKPALKLAENNTQLVAKLLQSQSSKAAELLERNLEHAKSLSETKDVQEAVERQQKYLQSLNEELIAAARENASMIESAVTEAGKILEGSLADMQTQAREAVAKLEADFAKATKAGK